MRGKLLNGVAALAIAVMLGGTLAGTAMAADPEPVPGFEWTGFYIGAHGAAGKADFDGIYKNGDSDLPVDELDVQGVGLGLHAGYNYQWDSFVLGVEGDYTYTAWDDERQPGGLFSAEVESLASIRARLGFVATERTLVYATGGVAWADASYSVNGSEESGDVNFNDVGGVFGGGVEYAVTDTFSVRAEGLYYIFDDERDTGDLTSSTSTGDFAELQDVMVVRVGASIHFF